MTFGMYEIETIYLSILYPQNKGQQGFGKYDKISGMIRLEASILRMEVLVF